MFYKFIGPDVRTYPAVMVDGLVLVAEPGDVRELDVAPNDGNWIAVKPDKSDKKAGA